jgi:acyl carrier protein
MDRESETTAAILGLVREVLNKPTLGADQDVFDHGATSLSFVRILALVNERYGVMVPVAELAGSATARALAAQVVTAPTNIGA